MCGLIYGWIKENRRRRMAKAAVVSGFLGAALGAAAGILLAPQSGEETRENIENAFQDTWDSARHQIHRVGQSAKQVTDDLTSSFQDNHSHNKKEDYSKGYAAGFRAALDELSDEWDSIEATFGHGATAEEVDGDQFLERDPFGLTDEPEAFRRSRRASRGPKNRRSNRENRAYEIRAIRQEEAARRQEKERQERAREGREVEEVEESRESRESRRRQAAKRHENARRQHEAGHQHETGRKEEQARHQAMNSARDSADSTKEVPSKAEVQVDIKVRDAKPLSQDLKVEEIKTETAKESSSKGKDKK